MTTQPKKIPAWEELFEEEIPKHFYQLCDDKEFYEDYEVETAYENMRKRCKLLFYTIISKEIAKAVEEEKERIAAKLNKIVEKGAPSEQESPLQYGAEIWNEVHNLRNNLLDGFE